MRKLQQNKTKEQQEMIHEIARNKKQKKNSISQKQFNLSQKDEYNIII